MIRLPKFTRRSATLSLLLTALAAPALVPASPVAAQAARSSDLASVSTAVRGITTLSGDFTQTDRNGQVQNGKLLWKQPGKIRFDYGAGDLLIVADGSSLYMIDYQVAQVQRWPIRNSPLGALLDPKRDITRYGKVVDTGDPRVVSVEVRDPQHPEYGVITLIFTRKAGVPGGLSLYGWVALDAQGNRTNIRLSNLKYGAPIADAAFRWRDPRGTRGPR
ncbi:LolA family protein [Sphingobium sp. B12D2B]|uniref:LolA family protein n=1 Tax=Sphingobium sp. B12D2B TaxID=2940577 RepID=UPI00222496C8|nr:outer membrane lipoprotein carrier protein LolA [Sphingobium sp. B12D2B]MCW2348962.1 outer membrane lipoprotein-sorting protein [Sphingobium sp. B12D2B]